MAGAFPEGREFNVHCDTPASIVVFENWPTDIVLSGFEIGNMILTGKRLVQLDIPDSPVREAYELCFAEGDPDGRQSWDQTAAWIASKGPEPFFDTERGVMRVDSLGGNDWTPTGSGRHIRIIERMPPTQVAYILESYMMHQPTKP
jgi:hypothetical protein